MILDKIFRTIQDRVLNGTGLLATGIVHFGWMSKDVDFLLSDENDGEVFNMPAILFEWDGDPEWESIGKSLMQADLIFNLHLIMDQPENLDQDSPLTGEGELAFDHIEVTHKIDRNLHRFSKSGEFGAIRSLGPIVDHDFDVYVHHILRYEMRVCRDLANTTKVAVSPALEGTHLIDDLT